MTVSVAMVDCRGRSMPAVFQRANRNGRIQICRTGILDIWENTSGQF